MTLVTIMVTKEEEHELLEEYGFHVIETEEEMENFENIEDELEELMKSWEGEKHGMVTYSNT